MEFWKRAIVGTVLFIFGYMFIAGYVAAQNEPVFSYRWIKDMELSFSSITSIGALFWALYSVYKYRVFANFENQILKTSKGLGEFIKNLDQWGKIINNTGLLELFEPEPESNNNEQKLKELENKYINDDK